VPSFDPNRVYDPAFDVRDHGALLDRVQNPPPGLAWLLLLPRRYGKTWTLKALAHALGDTGRYLNLDDPDDTKRWETTSSRAGEIWLLDEPWRLIPQPTFLSKLRDMKRNGRRVILALTPNELARLEDVLGGYGIADLGRSILDLPPLTLDEAKKIARSRHSADLLPGLPEHMQWTPFLLELLFHAFEQGSSHRPLKSLLDASDISPHNYYHSIFYGSLNDSQQATLIKIARNEPFESPREPELLERAKLVVREGTRWRVADPILEARMTPLRIHHISDVHVGPKAADSIDVKQSGATASAVNPGKLRDAYVAHLASLRSKGEAPHLIAISGDLTEEATDGELEEARTWVDGLLPLLAHHPLLEDNNRRILLVGGNHDVRWPLAVAGKPGEARHLPFAEKFDAYPHPQLHIPPEQRLAQVVAWPDLGLEVLLLGTSQLGGEREKYTSDDGTMTIDRREDPGLVHHKDLERADRQYCAPIRIALLHHPPTEPLQLEVKSFRGLLNAGHVKQALVNNGFCLALCGHTHAGWFVEETWPERKSTFRIATAPSLGREVKGTANGFNQIKLVCDRDVNGTASYHVTVTRISWDGAGWSPAAGLSFTPAIPSILPPRP